MRCFPIDEWAVAAGRHSHGILKHCTSQASTPYNFSRLDSKSNRPKPPLLLLPAFTSIAHPSRNELALRRASSSQGFLARRAYFAKKKKDELPSCLVRIGKALSLIVSKSMSSRVRPPSSGGQHDEWVRKKAWQERRNFMSLPLLAHKWPLRERPINESNSL